MSEKIISLDGLAAFKAKADEAYATPSDLAAKQDTLISGTNIKTIEGQSLLGSGNIDLTKSDVGLGNVDNTSDANKPISTATQTALNKKLGRLVVDGTLPDSSTPVAISLTDDQINVIRSGQVDQILIYDDGSSVTYAFDKVFVNDGEGDYYFYCHLHFGSSSDDRYYAILEGNSFTIRKVDPAHDSTKQDTLVSGTNIKTINDQSLLGSGNIDISAVYPFTITVAQMQAAMEAPVSLTGFPVEMSEGVTTVALSIVQEADPEQGIAEDTLMAVVPLTLESSVYADPTTQEIVNKRIWVGMLGADSSGVSANVKFMIDGGSLNVRQGGAPDGYLVPEWTSGTGYPAFWFVRHNDLIYMALEAVNDDEWTSSHWSAPVSTAYDGITQSALRLLILISNATIDASHVNSGSATSGQVLTANGSGGASWQTPASPGMSNPMTAAGDLIVGGTDGAPTRLAKSSGKTVLRMNSAGTAPEWDYVTNENITSGSATQGKVLTADGQGDASWETPPTGMTDPTSATGDLIYRGQTGVPARLGIGTPGQVLGVNSDGNRPEWQTPQSGGGVSFDGEVTCFMSNSGIFTMQEASAQSVWDICSAEYTASSRREFIFKILGSDNPGNGLCFVSVVSPSSFDPSIQSIDITCWWYTNMQKRSLTERPTGNVTGFTSTKLNNPMSAAGDLIVGGTNGALEKLAKGSAGQVLSVNDSGTGIEWKTPSSGMANPMTTQDDVIVGGTSGAPERLAKGSNHQLLGINGSGHVGFVSGLPYSTSAPTSANTEGNLKIVVLASEPATKYDGYLYIITGE